MMSESKNPQFGEEIYNSLPPKLRKLTDLFKGREKDIVLLSSIGVLSSIFPKYIGIYDGKEICPNLYVMIIAPPASGKGVMNYARDIINPIHKKVLAESRLKIKNWKIKKKRDEAEGPIPPLKRKIIPANTSSAELYNTLMNIHYSGIMIESEADTLSIMFKQEWGNFSDVLRKAFHQEAISISRKDDKLFLEIDKPCLSLVLSGTPDQLGPLVQSKDNGLFSRFIYYNFDTVSKWKDVFLKKRDLKGVFEELSTSWAIPMYGDFCNRVEPLQFKFTKEQEVRFNKEMGGVLIMVGQEYPEGFRSVCIRHGHIFYRICMILTGMRFKSEINTFNEVTCIDEDFEVALKIIHILLFHAHTTYENASDSILPALEEQLLFTLDSTFFRKDAVVVGESLGFPERTVDEKLVQWRRKRIIKKMGHGEYKRL